MSVVTNARPDHRQYSCPARRPKRPGYKQGDIVEQIQTADTTFDLRTLNTDRQSTGVHDFLVAHQDQSIALVVQRGSDEKNFILKAQEASCRDARCWESSSTISACCACRRRPPYSRAASSPKYFVGRGCGPRRAGQRDSLRAGADLNQVSGPIGHRPRRGAPWWRQGFGSTVVIIALISLNPRTHQRAAYPRARRRAAALYRHRINNTARPNLAPPPPPASP